MIIVLHAKKKEKKSAMHFFSLLIRSLLGEVPESIMGCLWSETKSRTTRLFNSQKKLMKALQRTSFFSIIFINIYQIKIKKKGDTEKQKK